jgi:hypothetical protein
LTAKGTASEAAKNSPIPALPWKSGVSAPRKPSESFELHLRQLLFLPLEAFFPSLFRANRPHLRMRVSTLVTCADAPTLSSDRRYHKRDRHQRDASPQFQSLRAAQRRPDRIRRPENSALAQGVEAGIHTGKKSHRGCHSAWFFRSHRRCLFRQDRCHFDGH